jgi:phosphatidylethanolamine/phosphatidyl-N-methylethanolamine N-methyltransferase
MSSLDTPRCHWSYQSWCKTRERRDARPRWRNVASFDPVSFFLAWLAAPRRVGAVAPSSDALAKIITRDIGKTTGAVVELGPGTGAFTDMLLRRGVRQEDLTLIEYGSEFIPGLQLRFPGIRVIWMDAASLGSSGVFRPGEIGAVVSGLPLLSMSPRKVMAILEGAFSAIRPGGAFYQFTYGVSCPVSRPILDRLGLKAVRVDTAILNLPPATVYRLTRRNPRPMRSIDHAREPDDLPVD